jgi:3-oxoacyl-[acyl-carrier protein] reductase
MNLGLGLMNELFNFSEKKVLITGASRGIGFSILNTFMGTGAKIIATATTESSCNNLRERLPSSSHNVSIYPLDIASTDSVESLFSTLKGIDAMPHILINNAGITRDNLVLRMSDNEWDQVISTNLTGTFRMCKKVVRQMMKYKFGKIINISSVIAHTGNPGQVNYAATKAGIIGLTKSLAREIGTRNITVNAISPGFIKTDMTDNLDEENKSKLLNQIPLSRLGSPEDVANAALFLSSDLAGYITGETIHVNGGLYLS